MWAAGLQPLQILKVKCRNLHEDNIIFNVTNFISMRHFKIFFKQISYEKLQLSLKREHISKRLLEAIQAAYIGDKSPSKGVHLLQPIRTTVVTKSYLHE